MDVKLNTFSSGKEYEDLFEPKSYLDYRFKSVNERHAEFLRHLHRFYSTVEPNVKVIDVGSGPIIAYVISAVTKASELVFAEYTEKNREEIQRWIACHPDAHNWGSYFEFIVKELEGKGDEEVSVRAQQLRQIIKAVIPCDITRDPPVESAFFGPYDIVTSSLCLEAACSTKDDYIKAVARLWKLLKDGGRLLLQCVDGASTIHHYIAGNQKFTSLSATPTLIRTALEKAGFHDIAITQLPKIIVECEKGINGCSAMYFVVATK